MEMDIKRMMDGKIATLHVMISLGQMKIALISRPFRKEILLVFVSPLPAPTFADLFCYFLHLLSPATAILSSAIHPFRLFSPSISM